LETVFKPKIKYKKSKIHIKNKNIFLCFLSVFLIFDFWFLILQAEDAMDKVKLPKPNLKGNVSLEEAIQKRRSVRSYSSKDLTLDEIGQLCWAAQGITDKRGLRAAPSAGALYPLEIYIVKKDGLYHYIPDGHLLEKKIAGDLRDSLCKACFGQNFIREAPIDFVICAVYQRVASRYRERGVRYTDIEVGHAAQNVHLEAVALGLDSVPVGAFIDEEVSKALSLPKEEKPIYVIPIGYKK